MPPRDDFVEGEGRSGSVPHDASQPPADDGNRYEYAPRACDGCRKMKIKCTDKENPPCKRCRNMKLQCRFSMPPMPRVVIQENEETKSRISDLEGHVAGIFQKLDEMSNVLLRMSSVPATGTPSTMVSEGRQEGVSPRTTVASYSPGDGIARTGLSSRTSQADLARRPGLPHALSQSSRDAAMASHSASMDSTPWTRPSDDQRAARSTSVTGSVHNPYEPRVMPGASSVGSSNLTTRPREPSTSPVPSDVTEDDPLQSAMNGEPFRHFARHEEEVLLRAHGHGPARSPVHPQRSPGDKRRRVGRQGEWTHGPDMQEYQSPIRERGDPLRHSADPINMGLVSFDEAKRLFDAFMKYAHPFVPVFDAREDTFESLRKRSPFCVTVIILVALRQRESTGPPSDLCNVIQEEVEKMSKATLFSPMATLETVQGLAILISYSDNAWRLCCHAMALAVDMRLYRCLPYLHKIRTDSRQPNHLMDRQRPLVVGARLWLVLVRLAYEMSYNHALPVLFPSSGGKRTQYAREFLDHPMSTAFDSRLVFSLELCEVRECAFRPYESVANQDQDEMDEMLRRANHGINALYEYWLEYYENLGLPRDHFLLIELSNQRAYAIMFTNSPAWYGVEKKDDVKHLSSERQQWVSAALRGAAFLVSSVANKRLEKDSEFGNHNFHVGIVATARYLIRMCELLPDVVDRFETSLDIDKLLLKLPYYPLKPFVDGLRRTLTRAREQGILPYTQMSEAATRGTMPSPQGSDAVAAAVADAVAQFPGFNPFPWHDPVQTVTNTVPDGQMLIAPPAVPRTDSISLADGLNLAAWFPIENEPVASLPMDISALDADMANWFPAAPHVWPEES